MNKLTRRLSMALVMGLFVLFVAMQGDAFQSHKAKDSESKSDGKEILGKWTGGATTDGESEVLQVTFDLRLDGDKILGDIHSDASDLKVTNVAFAKGAWSIDCVSADGQEAKINCSIKNGKLVGDWSFGGNIGKFEFVRVISSPK